jgi:hypothetical protein
MLPFLGLPLYDTSDGAQLEALAIAEPGITVWFAFDKFDALCLEGGIEVSLKSLGSNSTQGPRSKR